MIVLPILVEPGCRLHTTAILQHHDGRSFFCRTGVAIFTVRRRRSPSLPVTPNALGPGWRKTTRIASPEPGGWPAALTGMCARLGFRDLAGFVEGRARGPSPHPTPPSRLQSEPVRPCVVGCGMPPVA